MSEIDIERQNLERDINAMIKEFCDKHGLVVEDVEYTNQVMLHLTFKDQ